MSGDFWKMSGEGVWFRRTKCPARVNQRQSLASRCPAKSLIFARHVYSEMSSENSKCPVRHWRFAGQNVRRGSNQFRILCTNPHTTLSAWSPWECGMWQIVLVISNAIVCVSFCPFLLPISSRHLKLPSHWHMARWIPIFFCILWKEAKSYLQSWLQYFAMFSLVKKTVWDIIPSGK